jgi:hypothetical protein
MRESLCTVDCMCPAPLPCPPQVLKNIKSVVEAHVSVTHSATILANAGMHAGGRAWQGLLACWAWA